MSSETIGGLVIGLSAAAALVFAGVAINEIGYVNNHPHAYGPAKVIAIGSAGGVLLSIAVGLVGWALTIRERDRR